MRSVRTVCWVCLVLGGCLMLAGCMLIGFDEVNLDGGSPDAGDSAGQAPSQDAGAPGDASGDRPDMDGGTEDGDAGMDAAPPVDAGGPDSQTDTSVPTDAADVSVDAPSRDAADSGEEAAVDSGPAVDAGVDARDSAFDADGDDAGSGECTPYETWCQNNIFMACDPNGTVGQSVDCSTVSSGCRVGACNPENGCDMVPATDNRICGLGATCNLEGVCVGGGDACASGASPCEISCDADLNLCALDCNAAAACSATCGAQSGCDIDCATTEEGCEVTCAAGAECDIDCRESGNCNAVTCSAGAKCLLRCATGSENCGFAACQSGEPLACSGDILVCNRDCPP